MRYIVLIWYYISHYIDYHVDSYVVYKVYIGKLVTTDGNWCNRNVGGIGTSLTSYISIWTYMVSILSYWAPLLLIYHTVNMQLLTIWHYRYWCPIDHLSHYLFFIYLCCLWMRYFIYGYRTLPIHCLASSYLSIGHMCIVDRYDDTSTVLVPGWLASSAISRLSCLLYCVNALVCHARVCSSSCRHRWSIGPWTSW